MADPIQHGAATPALHPTANRGVHPLPGLVAVETDAQRVAYELLASDVWRVLHQTKGTAPGLHGVTPDEAFAFLFPLVSWKDLDLYIDPVDGDDANDGLTTGTPVATFERLDGLIPPVALGHVVKIHCAAGEYTFTRNFAINNRLRIGRGCIRIFADEAWDPTVFTVLRSGTAAASTGEGVIKDSGLSADAWKGKLLRLTSGDCAGMYRYIRNNTTTDIIPDEAFGNIVSQTPASGNTYEILQLNVVFKTPNLAAAVNNDAFWPIRNSGQGSYGDNNGTFDGDGVYDELRFIRFDGSGSTGTPEIVLEGNVNLKAVESNCRFLVAKDAHVYSGAPYDAWDHDAEELTEDYLGAGVSFTLGDTSALSLIGWGTFVGYINTNARLANHGVLGVVKGGRMKSASYSHLKFDGMAWGTIRILVDDHILLAGPNASDPRHDMGPLWWIWGVEFGASPVDTGPRLELQHGFRCILGGCTGESTGATTVLVREGYLELWDAPALGKAAGNDWSCNNGTDHNKSFFDEVGDAMVNLGTLSVIRRTD